MSRIKCIKIIKSKVLPKVTLLISAYNEEKVIEDKINNSLRLDYPKRLFQIIVVSDGSTDKTDSIARKLAKKHKNELLFCRVEGRRGKNTAINEVIKHVKGDIIVFSDANSIYDKDAIKKIVRNFFSKKIGCVSGELRYIESDSGIAKSEGLYWKYEQFLKRQESRMGFLLSANGAIFAIRKDLFERLHPKIANDFQIPQDVASKGNYVIYEPAAIAYETVYQNSIEEFNVKIRVIARGFEGAIKLFYKFRGIRLFELLSHKLLRWFTWFFLVMLLISNIFLISNLVFLVLFSAQLVFYTWAFLGIFIKKGLLARIPYYFLLIQLAAFLGLFRFVFGIQKPTWDTAATTRKSL